MNGLFSPESFCLATLFGLGLWTYASSKEETGSDDDPKSSVDPTSVGAVTQTTGRLGSICNEMFPLLTRVNAVLTKDLSDKLERFSCCMQDSRVKKSPLVVAHAQKYKREVSKLLTELRTQGMRSFAFEMSENMDNFSALHTAMDETLHNIIQENSLRMQNC